VSLTIQRSGDQEFWSGTTWVAGEASVLATGTSTWSYQLPISALGIGVSYRIVATATDSANETQSSAPSAFTYQ
jgi:hypothetical protein